MVESAGGVGWAPSRLSDGHAAPTVTDKDDWPLGVPDDAVRGGEVVLNGGQWNLHG